MDFILYIFNPAFFIILPHIVILPSYKYFTESFSTTREKYLATAIEGVRKFFLGFSQLILCKMAAVANIYFISKMQFLPGSMHGIIELAGVLFFYVRILLFICGYGNILLGLVKGLGYDIKSPFRKPFLAKNIIDLFDRFILYFKEYLLGMFYMPAVIFANPLNQYLRSFVAIVFAVAAGVSLYAFLSLNIVFCAMYANPIQGIGDIFRSYAAEHIVPVGIRWYHFRMLIIIGGLSLILGFVLGAQFLYNFYINTSGKTSLFVSKMGENKFLKLLQIFFMILFIWMSTVT